MNFNYEDRLVYQCRSGSLLYGTWHGKSDEDLRGIIIPPLEYFVGLSKFEQYEGEPGEDICYYDIRKFFKLALAGNPNIIEILWANEPQCQYGQRIRDMRRFIVTKAIAKPHIGMAVGNLVRFKSTGKLKLACHAIRVLGQCLELLQYGRIDFPRPNAVFLREVLKGKIESDDIEKIIEDKIQAVKDEVEASEIRKEPDKNLVSGMMGGLIIDYLRGRIEL